MDISFSRQITRQMVHAKRGALQHEIERVGHTLRALRRWEGSLDADPHNIVRRRMEMLESRDQYLRAVGTLEIQLGEQPRVDDGTVQEDQLDRSNKISLAMLNPILCSVLLSLMYLSE